MWSNLIDRAWLFGGKSEANRLLQNSLWRFEPSRSDSQWTSLELDHNMSDSRPSNGAGCNVPILQTGYYLGGIIVSDHWPTHDLHFRHVLTAFNMETETLSSFDVPDFVPIVNQSLIYLNTGRKDGVLVALGSYREQEGKLELVGYAVSVT